MLSLINETDVIVFSSQKYGSKEIRTSALMDHMALGRKVYFINKPIIGMTKTNKFFYTKEAQRVTVVQPYLAAQDGQEESLSEHLRNLIRDENLKHISLWSDTIQSESLLATLDPKVTVYDGAGIFDGCDVVLGPAFMTESILRAIEGLSTGSPDQSLIDESSENIVWLNNQFNRGSKYQDRPFKSVISRYQQVAGN